MPFTKTLVSSVSIVSQNSNYLPILFSMSVTFIQYTIKGINLSIFAKTYYENNIFINLQYPIKVISIDLFKQIRFFLNL